MKNRSGKLQQRNKPMSKSSKSKLQIATGLAFFIFAVWLFMSTKNYASNSYPLVSEHITIEHENRSLELDEAQSKNISKRKDLDYRNDLATGYTISDDLKKYTVNIREC